MISKREIEISYSDTDMMGIVYHGSYVVYFEFGRTKFLKDMGFEMNDCFEKELIFPVAEMNIKFISPTVYGTNIDVHTMIHTFSKSSTTYLHEIYQNDKLCVKAYVKLAHVNSKSFKPVNISKVYPELYEKYSEVKNYG